jgi:hypothetical protein
MTPKYSTETAEAFTSEPLPFEYSQPRVEVLPPPLPPGALSSSANPHQIAARGFAATFGLHPAMAALTVAVDLMLQGADIVSGGLLIPFSIGGGAILGYIVYKSQMRMYGDDDETAKIKALIVAFLTAIPSPLPYILFVPAGLVGLFNRRRG